MDMSTIGGADLMGRIERAKHTAYYNPSQKRRDEAQRKLSLYRKELQRRTAR